MRCAVVTVAFVAVTAMVCVPAHASLLFSDDFNTGTVPDPGKWTLRQDPGCQVYLDNGSLYASFTGASMPRAAYATSVPVDLPPSWDAITLRGEWAFPQQSFGECYVWVIDADNPARHVRATYFNWPSKGFRLLQNDVEIRSMSRPAIPTDLTPFELTVTRTGWSFVTENGAINESYATTEMASLNRVQVRIGGWEYSYVTNLAKFDNIVLTPEPGTLAVLAASGLMLFLRRRAS